MKFTLMTKFTLMVVIVLVMFAMDIPRLFKPRRYYKYEDYLNSPIWQVKRQQAFNYYGRKCMLCGARKKPLQVHHNNYSNGWGNEEVTDLIVLCNTCHAKHHGKLK